MALDSPPLLTRKRQLAFKLQTSTGTAATLTGTEAVTRVYDPVLEFDDNIIERQPEGTLTMPTQSLGARGGSLTFETELVGSGSGTPPTQANLFKACGYTLGSGNVLSPVDGATDIMTFGLYEDGLLKQLTDAMGTFTIKLKAGEKGRVKWNFMGVGGVHPSDTAILTPTKSTVIAPRVGASAFTVNSKVLRCDVIEIEGGNTVILREDLLAVDATSEATGYRSAYITARQPIIRMTPEARLLATEDIYSLQRTPTTVAITTTFGAVNNGFIIAAPAGQLNRQPKSADRKGMLGQQLEFLCTGTGQDELTITYQ